MTLLRRRRLGGTRFIACGAGSFFVLREGTAIFGPEGFGGVRGGDGEITGVGGAKVAIIARWNLRRAGTRSDGRPELRFRAWFSWRNDTLMGMCQKGIMKGRVRVFMMGKDGREQIDIVSWAQWELNPDGMLTLEDVISMDTAPLRGTP